MKRLPESNSNLLPVHIIAGNVLKEIGYAFRWLLLQGYTGVSVVAGEGRNAVGGVFDFIDKRRLVRRTMLGGVSYMTYVTWHWVLLLDNPTTQQVAIFAAVNTLLAAMIKFYSDSRKQT